MGGRPPAGLSPDEQHAWDQLDDFYKNGLGYALEMNNRGSADFRQQDIRPSRKRVNAICLPSVDDNRRNSDLFLEGTRTNKFQQLTRGAMENGFQTRAAEMNLAKRFMTYKTKRISEPERKEPTLRKQHR